MSASKFLFRLHQTPSLRCASGTVASPESFYRPGAIGLETVYAGFERLLVRALFDERKVPDEAMLEGMLSAAPVTECGYSAP
jgi:hypothetical protein